MMIGTNDILVPGGIREKTDGFQTEMPAKSYLAWLAGSERSKQVNDPTGFPAPMDARRKPGGSQCQRHIVSFRTMFFHQAFNRQVGQDITAVNDKGFVPDLGLNVFDASSGLQQIRFMHQLERRPVIFAFRETERKISPANGAS